MLSLSRARAPAPQGVPFDNDGTLLDFNATWAPAAAPEPGWWPADALARRAGRTVAGIAELPGLVS